jgi:hypothetical protein
MEVADAPIWLGWPEEHFCAILIICEQVFRHFFHAILISWKIKIVILMEN